MDTLYDFTKVTFSCVKTREKIQKTALLAAEIWGEYYPPILGQAQVEYMIATYQSRQAIERGIEGGCMYFIVSYDGEEAGYFAVEPGNPEGKLFLSKIYLKAQMRGRGIFRAVWQKVTEIAKEYGLDRVWLTVNKYNAGSIAVYEKLGFERTDSIVTPIGDGFVMDDYVMERGI